MNAEKYKSTRKDLGFTQRELAALLGVTNKTISERERGLVKISKEAESALLQLSKAR